MTRSVAAARACLRRRRCPSPACARLRFQVWGRYGFRFVNRPLLAFAPSIRQIGHAYRLPELWNSYDIRRRRSGRPDELCDASAAVRPGTPMSTTWRVPMLWSRPPRRSVWRSAASREGPPAAGRQEVAERSGSANRQPAAGSGSIPPRTGPCRRKRRRSPVRVALDRPGRFRRFAFGSGRVKSLRFNPPMAIAAMAALALAPDHLAQRRGAVAATDRSFLSAHRAWSEPARPGVRGCQGDSETVNGSRCSSSKAPLRRRRASRSRFRGSASS